MKSFRRSLLAAFLLVGLAASPSQGAIAYGVTLIGNQLITLDTTTGAANLVGPLTGDVAPFGLAGFGGRLYTFDSNADVIRQISPTTGATAATFDIGVGPVLGQGGLALQSSSVGYLTTALDPNTFEPANNLYRFDLTTGTTTLVTNTADTLSAIAFAANGTLYGLGKLDGNLYTLDPTTGAMNLVGNVGVTLGNPVNSLAFGTDGTLFATLNDTLYSLNLTNGIATAIGDPATQSGFASISGLAFTDGVIPNVVPEPASMTLLVLGVVGPAVLARRRSRRVA